MSETLFNYDEADVILRGDGQSDFVGVNAVDGLIAAVAAGPAFIPTHEWMPQIFGKRNPLQTSGTPEHRLARTIQHRHDEVVEILATRPEAYLPLLVNAEGRAVMTDWSIGFLLGVGMRSAAWGPLMISDFGMTLAPILAVNPMGRELLLGVSQAEIDRIAANAHETIAVAVVALYRHCAGGRPASRRLAKLRGGRRR
ncbi:yecA family protein [Rhodoblastus sphagnicola]|uniref:YecA/YgfB family protein n=1 Tax=Rhodoblastus sphagnicola TaxID=333368 RepID=UPI00161719E9|nr:YecA family protein [Rhodoblastus sphagnicola]MBB4200448.1 yecA family protein [Rhodoblastus sphagnicola]